VSLVESQYARSESGVKLTLRDCFLPPKTSSHIAMVLGVLQVQVLDCTPGRDAVVQ